MAPRCHLAGRVESVLLSGISQQITTPTTVDLVTTSACIQPPAYISLLFDHASRLWWFSHILKSEFAVSLTALFPRMQAGSSVLLHSASAGSPPYGLDATQRPAQSNGSASVMPQQSQAPFDPAGSSNFNPWTSSTGERSNRSSRWAQHSQSQNPSTPRFANSSASNGRGSKPSGMPAPINIPQRSRRTSYGGTAYLQQPPLSNPNAPSFASDSDTDSQEDFDNPESMFPMEAEPSRPGSRSSDSSRRTKGDFADPFLPANKNPYGDFSSSIHDPVSIGSSAPARPRRQSFTSCNPAYNMDDMSSALPGEDPNSTARQTSSGHHFNSSSGSASARRPSFGGGNASNFATGGSKRGSAPSTRAPATTFLTRPAPRQSSTASSSGPSKIVGFDMPQPSPVSARQEPPSFRQQQNSSPGVRIRPKHRASFYIAQEEEYDSASSVGSMTPRSGSLQQTYGY